MEESVGERTTLFLLFLQAGASPSEWSPKTPEEELSATSTEKTTDFILILTLKG